MPASPQRPRASSDSSDPIATALRILRIFILLVVAAWVMLWFKYVSGAARAPRAGEGHTFWGPDTAGEGPLVQAVMTPEENQPGHGGLADAVGFVGPGKAVPDTSRLESSWRGVRLSHLFPSARRFALTSSGPARH